jgi:site-specific recombinase XerD
MNYYKTHQEECNLKTNEIASELPEYAVSFLASKNAIEESTRLEYARDIKNFLVYVITSEDIPFDRIEDIPVSYLGGLSTEYFNNYLSSISSDDLQAVSNGLKSRSTKMRKLSSLNSFYSYLFKTRLIPSNPIANVEKFRDKKREVITLDTDEVSDFIKAVDEGFNPDTDKRKAIYHDKTRTRDIMIIKLLLGTGIRVSELVGMDVTDVNLKKNLIHITRKGNKEDSVYLSDKLCSDMANYLVYRSGIVPKDGHEKALFISLRGQRLCVRSIENLVKKYNDLAKTYKHITPHKLRATYGTEMFNQCNDIYAVAELLGHESVETSRKYYVKTPNKERYRNVNPYGNN